MVRQEEVKQQQFRGTKLTFFLPRQTAQSREKLKFNYENDSASFVKGGKALRGNKNINANFTSKLAVLKQELRINENYFIALLVQIQIF